MKALLFIVGLIILLGVEIGGVYFIMPFPGSQRNETIDIAYFLYRYGMFIRLIGFFLMAYPAWYYIRHTTVVIKSIVIALLVFWLVVTYMFNFRFKADKMFYQPKSKKVVSVADNKI